MVPLCAFCDIYENVFALKNFNSTVGCPNFDDYFEEQMDIVYDQYLNSG